MAEQSPLILLQSWKGNENDRMPLTSPGIDVDVKVNLVRSIFKNLSQLKFPRFSRMQQR